MKEDRPLHTCGQCRHAKIGAQTKQDVTQRICMARPPQVVALHMPNGIALKTCHPPVALNDPACDLDFEQKLAIDMTALGTS